MGEHKLPEPLTFGSLRFVKREVDGRELRILQTYQSTWGQENYAGDMASGYWYDVPLVEETDSG